MAKSRIAILCLSTGMLFVASMATVRAQTNSGSPISQPALIADAASVEPKITIGIVVRGAPDDSAVFPAAVRCATAAGAAVVPVAGGAAGGGGSVSGDTLTISLRPSEKRKISVAEFPALTVTDSCTVSSTAALGTEVRYRSTQTPRLDGSVAEPQAGLIIAGRYQSSPALANGRTVEVQHTFAGDLLLNSVVQGTLLGSIPTYTFSIRCDGDGTRTISLGGGQTRLITGLLAGATCRVEQTSGGRPSVSDNSGDPNDGVVVVRRADPSCWDLRNTTPTCRSVVTVVNVASGNDVPEDNRLPVTPTTTMEPTEKTDAAATTAAPAPAPTPAPATPVVDEPAFTG